MIDLLFEGVIEKRKYYPLLTDEEYNDSIIMDPTYKGGNRPGKYCDIILKLVYKQCKDNKKAKEGIYKDTLVSPVEGIEPFLNELSPIIEDISELNLSIDAAKVNSINDLQQILTNALTKGENNNPEIIHNKFLLDKAIKRGAKEILNNNKHYVIRLDTKESSIVFAKDTNWCTTQSTKEYYEDYTTHNILYVVLDKNTGILYQIAIPKLECKNPQNSEVNLYNIINNDNELKTLIINDLTNSKVLSNYAEIVLKLLQGENITDEEILNCMFDDMRQVSVVEMYNMIVDSGQTISKTIKKKMARVVDVFNMFVENGGLDKKSLGEVVANNYDLLISYDITEELFNSKEFINGFVNNATVDALIDMINIYKSNGTKIPQSLYIKLVLKGYMGYFIQLNEQNRIKILKKYPEIIISTIIELPFDKTLEKYLVNIAINDPTFLTTFYKYMPTYFISTETLKEMYDNNKQILKVYLTSALEDEYKDVHFLQYVINKGNKKDIEIIKQNVNDDVLKGLVFVDNQINESIILEGVTEKRQYYPKLTDDEFETIINLDPTYNGTSDSGRYVNILFKLFNNSKKDKDRYNKWKTDKKNGYNFKKPEVNIITKSELPKLKEMLELLNDLDISLNTNDINSIKDIKQIIEDNKDLAKTREGKRYQYLINRSIEKGARLISDTSKHCMIRLDTKESSIVFAKDTNWCTTQSTDNSYDRYTFDSDLFVIFNKITEKLYQINIDDIELRDVENNEVTISEIINNDVTLKNKMLDIIGKPTSNSEELFASMVKRKLPPIIELVDGIEYDLSVYYNFDDIITKNKALQLIKLIMVRQKCNENPKPLIKHILQKFEYTVDETVELLKTVGVTVAQTLLPIIKVAYSKAFIYNDEFVNKLYNIFGKQLISMYLNNNYELPITDEIIEDNPNIITLISQKTGKKIDDKQMIDILSKDPTLLNTLKISLPILKQVYDNNEKILDVYLELLKNTGNEYRIDDKSKDFLRYVYNVDKSSINKIKQYIKNQWVLKDIANSFDIFESLEYHQHKLDRLFGDNLMFKECLLTEGINEYKKMYPYMSDEEFNEAINIDPTYNGGDIVGKYTPIILKLVYPEIKGKFLYNKAMESWVQQKQESKDYPQPRLDEFVKEHINKNELATIIEALNEYGIKVNASKINSLEDLDKLLETNVNKGLTKNPSTNKLLYLFDKAVQKGGKIVLETDKHKVLVPYTFDSSIVFAKVTKWCTTQSTDDSYDDYMSRGNLYIVLDMDAGQLFQIHFFDYCVKYEDDVSCTVREITNGDKELVDFFKNEVILSDIIYSFTKLWLDILDNKQPSYQIIYDTLNCWIDKDGLIDDTAFNQFLEFINLNVDITDELINKIIMIPNYFLYNDIINNYTVDVFTLGAGLGKQTFDDIVTLLDEIHPNMFKNKAFLQGLISTLGKNENY